MDIFLKPNGRIEAGEMSFESWGVEFSDSTAFFSLNGPKQYLSSETLEAEVAPRALNSLTKVSLADGGGILNVRESVEGGSILRTHEFIAERPTLLLDFVSRYVFPKHIFYEGVVQGETVVHENANVYHQHRIQGSGQVLLKGPKHTLEISTGLIETTEKFDPYIYVRDEPGSWVVHVRLLPKNSSNIVTKLNASWYNKAVPNAVNNLFRALGLQKHLLYRGERKYGWSLLRRIVYKFTPFTSYPLGRLEAGEKISITSECRIAEQRASA